MKSSDLDEVTNASNDYLEQKLSKLFPFVLWRDFIDNSSKKIYNKNFLNDIKNEPHICAQIQLFKNYRDRMDLSKQEERRKACFDLIIPKNFQYEDFQKISYSEYSLFRKNGGVLSYFLYKTEKNKFGSSFPISYSNLYCENSFWLDFVKNFLLKTNPLCKYDTNHNEFKWKHDWGFEINKCTNVYKALDTFLHVKYLHLNFYMQNKTNILLQDTKLKDYEKKGQKIIYKLPSPEFYRCSYDKEEKKQKQSKRNKKLYFFEQLQDFYDLDEENLNIKILNTNKENLYSLGNINSVLDKQLKAKEKKYSNELKAKVCKRYNIEFKNVNDENIETYLRSILGTVYYVEELSSYENKNKYMTLFDFLFQMELEWEGHTYDKNHNYTYTVKEIYIMEKQFRELGLLEENLPGEKNRLIEKAEYLNTVRCAGDENLSRINEGEKKIKLLNGELSDSRAQAIYNSIEQEFEDWSVFLEQLAEKLENSFSDLSNEQSLRLLEELRNYKQQTDTGDCRIIDGILLKLFMNDNSENMKLKKFFNKKMIKALGTLGMRK